MTITTKDKRFMQVAKKLMITSCHPKYHMSCVLVKGGRVTTAGTNSSGPPLFFLRFADNRGRHAEANCLFGLDKRLTKNSTLYIAGETRQGNIILSRPCKSCMGFIRNMGVKRVVYHSVDNLLIEEDPQSSKINEELKQVN